MYGISGTAWTASKRRDGYTTGEWKYTSKIEHAKMMWNTRDTKKNSQRWTPRAAELDAVGAACELVIHTGTQFDVVHAKSRDGNNAQWTCVARAYYNPRGLPTLSNYGYSEQVEAHLRKGQGLRDGIVCADITQAQGA